MTDREIVHGIRDYISQRGFSCSDGLIENFYLSLKSRPFVLLAGSSDTDMTRLPALFAEAIGAAGRYKQLTVRPDWMDSSDMFGCINMAGDFVPGAIIDFLKAAQQDPGKPYFLCLDRILLDRAEYYLGEILSAVESREQPERVKPLVTMAYYGRDTAAAERYGIIPALNNLYIVGTINMDETSRPLNQRFLDRVHTMRIGREDLCADGEDTRPQPMDISNDFLQTRYLRLDQCPAEVLQGYFEIFEPLNRSLTKASAYMGFRLRNDAILYLMHNRQSMVLEEADALDHEIAMKVLTRVQGSGKMILPVLQELLAQCAQYKKTTQKITQMLRQCEKDGFASFWD